MKKKILFIGVMAALALSLKAEECKELYTGGFTLKEAKIIFSPMVFYPGWHHTHEFPVIQSFRLSVTRTVMQL